MSKINVGLREAVAYAKGRDNRARVSVVHVPDDVDVRAIREQLGLSQQEFALRFGFSLGTVRQWEQKRRYPHGSARVLLKVINHEPLAVERALAVV